MNYRILLDTIGARPKSFALIALLAVLNLAAALYLSLRLEPELGRAQAAWFAQREILAGGRGGRVADGYRRAERDLARFENLLIPKKGFPRFLSGLFETAHNNGLQLQGIGYKPTLFKEQGMLTYNIAFTVSGRYAAVKSLLADLARYPEMVTLDSVSLSNASATEENVVLKVQMTAYLKTEGA